jgi:hypothetical protein
LVHFIDAIFIVADMIAIVIVVDLDYIGFAVERSGLGSLQQDLLSTTCINTQAQSSLTLPKTKLGALRVAPGELKTGAILFG